MGADTHGLAGVAWRLDAYAGHWLADDDLAAVTDWMAANQLQRCTAERPVVVDHGVITYGQDRSGSTVRPPRDIVLVTVPLRTRPPAVWQPTCGPAVLAAATAVFDRHWWSSGFGGVCVSCSTTSTDQRGWLWCHRDDAAPWPCPPVRAALTEAGLPVQCARRPTPRVLGDLLDPDANARAFAHLTRSDA